MGAGRLRSAQVAFDWVLRILAMLVLALMLATAVHNVSVSFDIWLYHMPFAARLLGIVGSDSFIFHPENVERFKGFPLLGEFIQGILWRVSGRPESTNLLAFSSVPIFAWFLRRHFSVPFHISVLALLAIPIVHTHAVDSHVDLPACAATAAVFLIAMRAFISAEPLGIELLVLAAVASAFAINAKGVVGPAVASGIAVLGLRTLFLVWRLRESSARRRYFRIVLGFALLLPLVFATPLKNAVLYGNPLYPLTVTVLGYQLPGPEQEYASSPVWLKDSWNATRFGASILELGLRGYADPHRWTVGQWAPAKHPGHRMGGFFNAYVLFHVLILGWYLLRDRTREVRVFAAGFALLTLITAPLPQSHELRYYMYWMLVLVAINLCLAFRPGAPAFGSAAVGGGAALALGFVLWQTRAVYAMPTGQTFSALLSEKVKARSVAKIRDGETVCVATEPHNFLWSAHFHPPRKYVIKSALHPRECKRHRLIELGPRFQSPRRRRRVR